MSQFVFGFSAEMASYGNGGGLLNGAARSDVSNIGAVNGPASAQSVSYTSITPTNVSGEPRPVTPTLKMNQNSHQGESGQSGLGSAASSHKYASSASAHYKTNFSQTTGAPTANVSSGVGGLLRNTYTQIKAGTVTNAALMEIMTDSINLQVSRAKDVNAPPQLEISGDAAVRRTLQTLLSYPQQRQLFRDLVGSNHGERVRSLFGAPPYNFLGEGDSLLLDAAGIAHGRVNMSYDTMRVPNYGQFGVATCIDEKRREYRLHMRVNASQGNDDDRTASLGIDAIQIALDTSHDGACELICRIPRTKRLRNDSRDEMIEAGHEVVFLSQGLPQMNELITLADAPALKSDEKTPLFSDSIQLMVRGVTSSTPRAATGRIRVTRAGR